MHTKRDPYICKRDLKKRPISIKRDRQKDSDIHEKRPTNKNYIQKKRQTKRDRYPWKERNSDGKSGTIQKAPITMWRVHLSNFTTVAKLFGTTTGNYDTGLSGEGQRDAASGLISLVFSPSPCCPLWLLKILNRLVHASFDLSLSSIVSNAAVCFLWYGTSSTEIKKKIITIFNPDPCSFCSAGTFEHSIWE